MLTRMSSLAALLAAGMTLAACQEEEADVTTVEAEVEEVEEAEATPEETGQEAEGSAETSEPTVTEVPAETTATPPAAGSGTTTTGTQSSGGSTSSQPAAGTGTRTTGTQGSGGATSSQPAATVQGTASEASDQSIDEVLTVETFDRERVVTYVRTAELDQTTRDALIRAVEEVDPSNETALNALISRLEIALGAGTARPAATTTTR